MGSSLSLSGVAISVETWIEGKKILQILNFHAFGNFIAFRHDPNGGCIHLDCLQLHRWRAGHGGLTTIGTPFGSWWSRAGTGPLVGHRVSGGFFLLCHPGRGPLVFMPAGRQLYLGVSLCVPGSEVGDRQKRKALCWMKLVFLGSQ